MLQKGPELKADNKTALMFLFVHPADTHEDLKRNLPYEGFCPLKHTLSEKWFQKLIMKQLSEKLNN